MTLVEHFEPDLDEGKSNKKWEAPDGVAKHNITDLGPVLHPFITPSFEKLAAAGGRCSGDPPTFKPGAPKPKRSWWPVGKRHLNRMFANINGKILASSLLSTDSTVQCYNVTLIKHGNTLSEAWDPQERLQLWKACKPLNH